MDILTEQAFEEKIVNENVVLVDFWAPWCGPCRMLTPIIDRLSEKYPDNVVKVNVDEMRNLASRYGVRGIPSVKIIKGGELMESMQGVQPGNLYEQKLEYYMS